MSDTFTSWNEWCMNNKFIYPLTVNNCEYKRLNEVHPLKQNDIMLLYEKIKHLDMKVWIFGSAVSMKCSKYSDVDLAIKYSDTDVLDKFHDCVFEVFNGFADIIDINEIDYDSQLYSNIWKGGIRLI